MTPLATQFDFTADAMTLVKPPITPSQLVRYAAAAGDFNRIHLEPHYAREAGHPRLVAHGMLTLAFVTEMLVRWAGAGSVRRLDVRFVGIVYEGDVLTCHARVVESLPEATRLEVWAERQDGKKALSGTAEVVVRTTRAPSSVAPQPQ